MYKKLIDSLSIISKKVKSIDYRALPLLAYQHIRKHKYIYAFSFMALVAVIILMSCQGLVNANGDNNTIAIHKQGGIV